MLNGFLKNICRLVSIGRLTIYLPIAIQLTTAKDSLPTILLFSAGRTVKQLAIDPTGKRLVVCFKETPLIVVFHAKQPTLVPRGSNLLSGRGIMRGPKWREPGEGDTTAETFFMNKPDPKAISINFANHFVKGALLSLVNSF